MTTISWSRSDSSSISWSGSFSSVSCANLAALLKPGGRLLMLEGSKDGVDALNAFRALFGLEPLPVKWHNLFFDDERLRVFMREEGLQLEDTVGPGAYFLLTRGVRPALDDTLNWDSAFNERAASLAVATKLGLGAKFSRLKLWVFRKDAARHRMARRLTHSYSAHDDRTSLRHA